MTTRTRADLVIKILEKLRIVPEGQTPEIEDTARVDRNLPSLMEQLAGQEIVYVGNLNAIPQHWFLSLAKIGAYELRDEFGIQGEALADLKMAYDEGVSAIKVITRGRPTYEPLKTVSF